MCRDRSREFEALSTVGLFAHDLGSESEGVARDAIAVALAFMAHDHRLLLHLSPSLAIPLLLAGETARAQLVLEDSERRQHPMVMLPGPRPEGPEAALFTPVEIGAPDDEATFEDRRRPRSVSLLERFEALGVVDARWMSDNVNQDLEFILEEEAPRAIVAVGWSDAMEEVAAAATRYGREHKTPLLVAGSKRGLFSNLPEWRDLETFAEFETPEIDLPGRDDSVRSEELVVAWRLALVRARVTLAAEALASRLAGNSR